MNLKLAFPNRQHLALIVCAVLAGCSHPSSSPPEEDRLPEYVPPAPSAKNATITGSFVDPGMTWKNQYWHVAAVDGLFVKDDKCRDVANLSRCYDHSVSLAPGMHAITVLATNGGGATKSLIVLDAKPGIHYVAKGKFIITWKLSLSDIVRSISWIENTADNAIVSDKESVSLVPFPTPAVYFIPVRR